MKKYWLILAMACLTVIGILLSIPNPRETALQLEREKANTVYPVAYSGEELLNGERIYLVSPFGEHSPINRGELIQVLSDQKPLPDNQFRVLRGEFESTELTGVRRLTVYETIYETKGWNLHLISSRRISKQHIIEKNQTTFNLNVFLNGYDAYVTDELEKVLTDYPDKDRLLTETVNWSPWERFQETGVASDGFEIIKGNIVFETGISLPLSKFYDVIDATYLKGDDLVAYDTYKHQKEQGRDERNRRA